MCLCEKSEEGVGVLDKFNVPYITVDSYPEWYKGSYVANDFSVASEMAAKHLYEQGCRKPAYFTAGSEMKDLSSFVKMQKYFNEYFINKGIPQQGCGVVEAGLSIKEGHAAFERVLKSGKKYDGIFCANDLCAMGVMQAAEKYNIIAGRDIAVVGIDDIEVSAFSRVSLTTIKQPYWTIAKIAMEKLVEGVESNLEIDVKIEFPAELIVRNSSKLLIK
jgi:DNA-binding LacI/PurR family transcriptional regulator